jgi:glycosyltransferase 2 family protein
VKDRTKFNKFGPQELKMNSYLFGVEKSSFRKRLILTIKLIITIGLCYFIFARVDWKELQQGLKEADIGYLFIVAIIMLFNIVFVSSLRWHLLLKVHSSSFKLKRLAGYYLTGMFFSNFLPTTIGGDGYRIYRIYESSRSKLAAILPVIFERLSGIMILVFLGFIASGVSYWRFKDNVSLYGLIFGFIILFCFGLILILSMEYQRILDWVLKQRLIPKAIKNFIPYLTLYKDNMKYVFYSVLLAFVFYILLFSSRLILLAAFGEPCSFFTIAVAVMISNIIASVPLSINGIGLMDGSFIFIIGTYGVSYESAVAVMILHRTMSIGVSLLGGAIYLASGDKKVLQG